MLSAFTTNSTEVANRDSTIASLTICMGGLSITSTSYVFLRVSIASAKRCEDSISSGFSGILPAGSVHRVVPLITCRHCSSVFSPDTKSDSPKWAVSRPSRRASLGLRMSASISTVFFTCANASARLDATVVLPSSGTEEVTSTVLSGESTVDSCTTLRTVRMPSAKVFALSSTTMRSRGLPVAAFISGSTPAALTSSLVSRS